MNFIHAATIGSTGFTFVQISFVAYFHSDCNWSVVSYLCYGLNLNDVVQRTNWELMPSLCTLGEAIWHPFSHEIDQIALFLLSQNPRMSGSE